MHQMFRIARMALGSAVATIGFVALTSAAAPVGKFPLPANGCAGGGTPVVLADDTNGGGVSSRVGAGLPYIDFSGPVCITQIRDYHWNGGQGANPGTIGLTGGPNLVFQVPATANGARTDWFAYPNRVVQPGNYNVTDSDQSTWSLNAQSDNRYFSTIWGYCLPPGNGASCVSGSFNISHSYSNNGGSGGRPMPAAPTPCHATTGAPVILENTACRGPVGTVMTFYVRSMPAGVTGLLFASGPMSTSTFAANGVVRPVGATLAAPVAIPGGLGPGSVFTVAAPASMCPGRGNWAYDIFLMGPGGMKRGDLDYFVQQC